MIAQRKRKHMVGDRVVATQALTDKDVERQAGEKDANVSIKGTGKGDRDRESGANHFFKILIIAYIASWVGLYLLVHHNKEAKDLGSSPSIINVVEVVKLIFASSWYCKSHSFNEFLQFFQNRQQFAIQLKRYVPIAALYAICNNLLMYNLKNNHPIVYQILSSSRLLMVAVVWQVLFKVQIPPKRKVALGLITAGFMTKCLKANKSTELEMEKSWAEFAFGTSLVMLQMACSVMASVYNEKNLKEVDCDQYLQNICLYLNSIVINLLVLAFLPKDGGQEPSLFSKPTLMIVVTLAAAGLMTSMILRSAGSVTKCVVTASITIVTCVIDVVFFNYHLAGPEAVAVVLVTMGSALYSLNFEDIQIKNAQENVHRVFKSKIIIIFSILSLITSMNIKQHIQILSVMMENEQIIEDMMNKENSPETKQPLMCTSEIAQQYYDAQADLADERQIQKVKEGEAMVAYIVEKLDEINAPVSLVYGTLLHEYRNNTDANPCIEYLVRDNDLDIALMKRHFYIVADMREKIAALFDWEVATFRPKRMVLIFTPRDQRRKPKAGFQLDVYGFETNPSTGLVYFPWDKVYYGMDSMMPLVKHKTIAYHGQDDGRKKDLYLYKPFNVSCNLENQFGSNFMTPDLSKHFFYRQDAYGHPACENRNMTESEEAELERQLQFGL